MKTREVTVTANSPKEAEKFGAELIHSGKSDDVEYIGDEDDGVECEETREHSNKVSLMKNREKIQDTITGILIIALAYRSILSCELDTLSLDSDNKIRKISYPNRKV